VSNDFESTARDTIRRLLEKQAPNGTRPEDCGRWADDVRALYEAYELGGPQAVEAALDALLQSNRALARLISGNPSPELAPQECPPLPDSVMLPDVSENAWLGTYKSYAGARSPMIPDLFHEGAALWPASVAIARRLEVSMPFDDVYPNLFVVWSAPTTPYCKTTGMSIARDLAMRVLSQLLAAQATSMPRERPDAACRAVLVKSIKPILRGWINE
jgi:hypothetical protein